MIVEPLNYILFFFLRCKRIHNKYTLLCALAILPLQRKITANRMHSDRNRYFQIFLFTFCRAVLFYCQSYRDTRTVLFNKMENHLHKRKTRRDQKGKVKVSRSPLYKKTEQNRIKSIHIFLENFLE